MNRKERRAMKSKVRKTKIRLLTAHAMGLKHEEAVVSIAVGTASEVYSRQIDRTQLVSAAATSGPFFRGR